MYKRPLLDSVQRVSGEIRGGGWEGARPGFSHEPLVYRKLLYERAGRPVVEQRPIETDEGRDGIPAVSYFLFHWTQRERTGHTSSFWSGVERGLAMPDRR